MLSSTRVLALSLASRALPAESSRQGLLRAIAQQKAAIVPPASLLRKRSLHRRRNGSTYATAAVAYADEDKDDRIDSATYEAWRTRRFPDPRPPDLVHGLVDESATIQRADQDDGRITTSSPTLEGVSHITTTADLVGMIHSDPLSALRSMPHIPPSQLSELTARDLSDLLKNVYKISQGRSKSGRDDMDANYEEPLSILRDLLYDLPSASGKDDAHLGRRFKRDLLGRFLRACTILDCDSLLQSTLKERLESQDIEGEVFIQPDIWSTELANRGKWSTIIDLLSPSAFPIQSFTPYTIYRLIQAHLAMDMAFAVPGLFRMYADLDIPPPPRAYSLLVQAYLMLGDMTAARQVIQRSIDTQVDVVGNQLAILKGYRELGRDKAFEGRVLEAMTGMEERSQATMLHVLMRLRVDDGDIDGAKQLLARFDCDYWLSPDLGAIPARTSPFESRLHADSQTHHLAFRMLGSTMSKQQLEESWRYLTAAETDARVTDSLVITLLRNLFRLGMSSTARAMITGQSSTEKETSITIPSSYSPGVTVLNALLDLSARAEGWRGVEQTLKLFRSRNIKHDGQTLTIVLSFIRDNFPSDPTALANLTNAVIRQSPNVKPSIDHLDLLLGQAVKSHARANQLAIGKNVNVDRPLDRADDKSTECQVGLEPREPFNLAVKSIVQSLRARGIRSTSRSLATRLRLNAQLYDKSEFSASPAESPMTDSPLHAAPSVRAVWDDMVSRGYKTDKRHFLALMKGYADSGYMAECEDVLVLARETGTEPTRGMWMVLMTAYGHVRRGIFDLAQAEKAFQAIRQSEQGLDIPAVCAMIGIYQRSGHRHSAAHLALRLVNNLLETDHEYKPALAFNEPSPRIDMGHLPHFTKDQFSDRSLAISTNALRLDHPLLALQVIDKSFALPATLPSRVREVVKSIRNRARARLVRGIASPIDYEAMALAEDILKAKSTAAGAPHGRRPIGPNGIRKKVLRLLDKGKTRGRGGRKLVSAREEKEIRGAAIQRAQANVE